jgi:integrase
MEVPMKRYKTDYPGVFFREAKRIGGKGIEKVYYVVYKKNGKVHEEKAGRQYADDMTPARAAGVRAELIEGKRLTRKEKRKQEQAIKDAEAHKWTTDRLFDEYINGRPNNKAGATDKGRYNNYLKSVFGTKEPKDILPLDVDRLRIKLLKKKSPQTARHVLNLLTWIVNFGVNKNLSERLPFQIQKPTVNNEKTEDLTPEQLAQLLTAIDEDSHPHAGPMMKMALFTGMRRGELFKLKWNHVNFESGFITLVDPKGGPDQKIPLNNAAKGLLKSHPKTKSPYVFSGRNGGQRTNIRHQVNRIKKEAGLPQDFRPLHGLRHVYASILASSGKVDLYTLQKLLTHKDPKMTQRYAHLRDEALKKASNLAGELIELVANGKVVNLEDHNK